MLFEKMMTVKLTVLLKLTKMIIFCNYLTQKTIGNLQ